MGNRVTREDFEWVYTEQPHTQRRKEILEWGLKTMMNFYCKEGLEQLDSFTLIAANSL